MKIAHPIQIVLLAFSMSAGTRANAEVIYSGPQNVIFEEFSFHPDPISLFDAPGTWDDMRLDLFVLEDPDFQNQYSFGNLLNIHGNFVEFALGSYFFDVKRFAMNDVIDGSNSWSGNSYKDFSSYLEEFGDFPFTSEHGEFRNATGYAGLRFTDGGNVYYGWMQVSITNYDNRDITATLIDWAYENTPEMEILAGAIPEPATISLLIGAVVVGGSLLRRRKLSRIVNL